LGGVRTRTKQLLTLMPETVERDHSMEFNRLTWTGLIVAAVGWTLLLLGATVSKEVWGIWDYFGTTVPDLSAVSASNSMILSGFGLAILGALQSGFSSLHLFFEAVLQRSQRAQVQAATSLKQTANFASSKIAEEGWMGDRAYVRFANGTVQIETLLGVRNFSSVDEAREFIGA
jgi:hypothetical protein